MTVFDPSGFSKGTHAYEVATRVRVVLPQVRSTKVTALHAHKFVIYQELKYHFYNNNLPAYFKANGNKETRDSCVGFDM